MNEVTYEYVRGVGWVPSTGHTFTLRCGTVVRIEKRTPEPGERYISVHRESPVGREFKLSLEGTGKWIAENKRFGEFSTATAAVLGGFDGAFFVVLPVG